MGESIGFHEAVFLFLKIITLVLHVGIGILMGQKWKEIYQYRHISMFYLIFHQN